MIRVQFKEKDEVSEREFPFYDGKIHGMSSVVCKDITSDPMNDRILLIRFSVEIIWEVKVKLIKHISSWR